MRNGSRLTLGGLAALVIVASIVASPSSARPVAGDRTWDQRIRGAHEVQSAGDVNGDGSDDFLVEDGKRSLWLVFGSTDRMDIHIEELGDRGFPIHVRATRGGGFDGRGIGDINGDGLDDIGVGKRDASYPGRGKPGIVYVIFGKTDSDPVDLADFQGADSRGFRIVGARDFDQTGETFSDAGDLNSDGLGDIYVGATFANTVYAVMGKTTGTDIDLNDFELGIELDRGYMIRTPATEGSGELGVSNAGDVNGDGRPDAVVGVSGKLDSVVFGEADPLTIDTRDEGAWGIKLVRGEGKRGIGWPFPIGDVTADGRADLLVRCCWGKINFQRPGLFWARQPRFVIVPGQADSGILRLSDMIDSATQILGPTYGTLCCSLAGGAVVNQDGRADLIFGASLTDHGQRNEGSVYIVKTPAPGEKLDLLDDRDWGYRIDGNVRDLMFGYQAIALKDVDGDGRSELATSTQGWDSVRRVFVYLSK